VVGEACCIFFSNLGVGLKSYHRKKKAMNTSNQALLSCSDDVMRAARCRADIAGRDELTFLDFVGLLTQQNGLEPSREDMQRAADIANETLRSRLQYIATTCTVGFCTVGCESSSARDDNSYTAIPVHQFDPVMAEETEETRAERISALLHPC
jgi:hypothetical protein